MVKNPYLVVRKYQRFDSLRKVYLEYWYKHQISATTIDARWCNMERNVATITSTRGALITASSVVHLHDKHKIDPRYYKYHYVVNVRFKDMRSNSDSLVKVTYP